MIVRLLLCSFLSFGLVENLCAEPSASKPVDLLSGNDLSQFQPTNRWSHVSQAAAVEGKTEIQVQGNGPILFNGSSKDTSIPYLFTRQTFGDVKVEVEFMIPKGSNSGVYLMGRYEVQIFDSFGKAKAGSADLGGIYAAWDKTKPKDQQWWGGTAPKLNAATAPGTWQTMEVVFHAPRFDADGHKIKDALFESVRINGQLVQENTSAPDPTASHPLAGEAASGPLVIQGDHGPIAIRSLKVTPLASPDSQTLADLDAYWAKVSRSVNEGDFETYAAAYHPDAVIVSGGKQTTFPIHQVLQRWKSDFIRTKAKEVASKVEFRFSHRYRDAVTAHETGVFRYTSQLPGAEPKAEYIDFECLLVKKDGRWLILMEYQKGPASEQDWEKLKD